MTPEEKADLVKRVEESIEAIIVGRKLKYMETTPEFVAGLLIGMEIAGLHGDKIKELYGNPIVAAD
jgi:hypothetical protein